MEKNIIGLGRKWLSGFLTLAVLASNFVFLNPNEVHAGTGNPGNGNMIGNERYAEDFSNAGNPNYWGGYLDLDPENGGVTVTSTDVTGFMWSQNFGWISMDPPNGGVTNAQIGTGPSAEGVLDGFAWGEQIGWIDFGPDTGGTEEGGVRIDANGHLHGTAWNEQFGFLAFGDNNQGSTTYTETPGDKGVTWARTEWTPDAIPADDPVLNTLPTYSTTTDVTPTWIAALDADEYYIEASTDPTFATVDANSGWIEETNTDYTFTGLTDGETYYYRVKSRDEFDNESDWSNVESTTISAAGPDATGANVTINESSPSADLDFNTSWTGFTETAAPISHYEVIIAKDAGFTDVVLEDLVYTDGTDIDYTGVDGEDYYVRVRAVDSTNQKSAYVDAGPIEVNATSGNVTGPQGQAIPNAVVEFTDTVSGETYYATTDNDGNYSVNLPEGSTYDVLVTHPTHENYTDTVTISNGAVAPLDVSLEATGAAPNTVTVSGTITDDPAGTPIEGVYVKLINPTTGEVYIAVTDADGNYTMEVPANTTFDSEITHPGYIPETGTLATTTPDETLSEAIALDPNTLPELITTQGTVLNNNNNPISGVVVTATEPDTGDVYVAITNDDGEYEFPLPEDTNYELTFQVPGFEPLTLPSVAVDAPSPELIPSVNLVPETDGNPTTTGSIVDENGNPIPGAIVTFTDPVTGAVYEAVTDADGEYEINLPEGNYDANVTADGFEPLNIGTVSITAPTTEVPEATMTPNSMGDPLLEGVVLDSMGNPISNATVTVTDPVTGDTYLTTTDAGGNYSLNVPPADYNVTAVADGYAPTTISPQAVAAPGPNTAPDISLSQNTLGDPEVSGTIEDGSGNPVADAVVTFTDPVTGDTFVTTTDANGEYTDNIPAGDYDVTILADEFEPETISPVTVASPGPNDQGTIALTPETSTDGPATGVLTSDGTTPIANATITFTDPVTGDEVVVQTDGSGNYTAPLADGVAYDVVVDDPANGQSSGTDVSPNPVTPTGGAVPTITATPTPYAEGTTEATGTITDGSGNPIADAIVTLTDPVTGDTFTTTTDASGNYTAPVNDGTPYEITVVDPDGSTGYDPAQTVTPSGGVIPDPATPLDELSEPQTEMTGVLTDSSGNPIPDAVVTLTDPVTGESYTTTTDASGNYTAPVVDGTTYDISVNHPTDGYGYDPSQTVTPTGGTIPDPNTDLIPYGTLPVEVTGHVEDAAGNPIAGATVVITDPATGDTFVTTTDAAGNYSAPLTNGTPYDVVVNDPANGIITASGLVPTGDVMPDIAADPTDYANDGIATGNVSDSLGNPIAGATLTFTDPITGDSITVVTDANGDYVAPLENGTLYDVMIDAYPDGFFETQVTPENNLVPDIFVTPQPYANIDVVVSAPVTSGNIYSGAVGNTMSGVNLTFVNDATGQVYNVTSGAEGSYSLNLPIGNYSVTAFHPTHEPFNTNMAVTGLTLGDIILTLTALPVNQTQSTDGTVQVTGGNAIGPTLRRAGQTRSEYASQVQGTEITKHNFASAYEDSQAQVAAMNKGEEAKVLTYTDDLGVERFAGYQSGRLATDRMETQTARVVYRDAGKRDRTMEESALVQTEKNQFFSSARNIEFLPEFGVTQFWDIPRIDKAYATARAMNTYGLLTPGPDNRFNPNAELAAIDILETELWIDQVEISDEAEDERTNILKTAQDLERISSDFNSNATISRRDALMTLVSAFDLETDRFATSTKFRDVFSNDKAVPAIVAADKAQWLEEELGRNFRPNEPITRIEFSRWMVAAYEAKQKAGEDIDISPRLQNLYKENLNEDRSINQQGQRPGRGAGLERKSAADTILDRRIQEENTEEVIRERSMRVDWSPYSEERPDWIPDNPNSGRAPMYDTSEQTLEEAYEIRNSSRNNNVDQNEDKVLRGAAGLRNQSAIDTIRNRRAKAKQEENLVESEVDKSVEAAEEVGFGQTYQ